MFCGKYERNECTLCPLLPSYEQVVKIMIMKMLIPMIIYDNVTIIIIIIMKIVMMTIITTI